MAQCVLAGISLRRGQQLRGREPMARRKSAYGVQHMAEAGAQGTHWSRSRNGTTAGGQRRVGACMLQTSAVTAAREGRATDSPAGRFDFSGAPDPQSGAPNPRSYGLPCAAPPLPHLRPMREWTTADVPGSAEGASHEGTWQTQIDLRDRPCRIHPRCVAISACPAQSCSQKVHHSL